MPCLRPEVRLGLQGIVLGTAAEMEPTTLAACAAPLKVSTSPAYGSDGLQGSAMLPYVRLSTFTGFGSE